MAGTCLVLQPAWQLTQLLRQLDQVQQDQEASNLHGWCMTQAWSRHP